MLDIQSIIFGHGIRREGFTPAAAQMAARAFAHAVALDHDTMVSRYNDVMRAFNHKPMTDAEIAGEPQCQTSK